MTESAANSHAERLVQDALDPADDPSIPTSIVLRKALRVARLRNDWEAQWWLKLEMSTVRIDDDDIAKREGARVADEVAAHMTPQEYREAGLRVGDRWIGGRVVDKATALPLSVSDLEQHVAGLDAQIEQLSLPQGLHPVDLYRGHEEMMSSRRSCEPTQRVQAP